MCVRYYQETGRLERWLEERRVWVADLSLILQEEFFPGYLAPIILPHEERGQQYAPAAWGMTPPWAKDPRFGKKNAYNARCETITEKPTFRASFRQRRCIVPATAFYERADGRWLRITGKDEVLAIAGLFEPPNEHCELPSFAMVTTVPNEDILPLHDRMPVLLFGDDLDAWMDLGTTQAELLTLLTPCPAGVLSVEDWGPVSRKGTASSFEFS